MVFWCMMLLFTLLSPATMIGFGRSFFKKAAQGYQRDVRLPDDDVHEKIRKHGSLLTVSAGGTGSSAA